ncbi:MAG: hypothetical protein KUA37_07070 [Desulfomicrobium sp.]|nr:hypothetical protein [Pseudomonadota bacterium]MBV1711753.1 hypothetical protein [Desulfomicrobium sp.]MBU4572659.1 hypothetical protein [Pseudomonadota bacterium]MBU4593560.1 hypothetical protein [Pseudomonadota bacterium]MBV1719185.1 hypothetical protein [Desulfomicrobium sp.]
MTIPHNALNDMARVFHFEFWLRYYFIKEKDEGLYIELSADQAKQMQTQFPDFWELADSVQGRPLSPELSQQSVVEFLQVHLEGKKFPANTVLQVLDSKEFSVEMYLFNTWLDLHEEQLMQKIFGFDYWMLIYDEWKTTEKAQQLTHSLKLQMQGEHGSVN